MSKRKFADPELSSVHSVKILLCYLMNKLGRPVEENQLIEIVRGSGVIDYFCFSEAMDALLKTGAVIKDNENNTFVIGEKGRLGSEYFNRYIPITFRRSILTAAYSYFAEIRRDNECSCETVSEDGRYMVNFSINDNDFPLLKMSLYAPDAEQAENITEKIRSNPSAFYMNVIKYLLENTEEEPDVVI